MTYWHLIRNYPRNLSFGIAHVTMAIWGQTSMLWMFVPYIQTQLGLSHGSFGTAYALITLASAMTMPFWGRLFDRTSVLRLSLLTISMMALGCWGLSLGLSFWWTIGALFLLRLSGQGIMTQIADVLVTRFFKADRSKAFAIVLLGYPLAESLFALLAALGLKTLGYSITLQIIGSTLFFVYLPFVVYLYRHRESALIGEDQRPELQSQGVRVRDVIRDPLFYVIAAHAFMPSLLLSGLYFFHAELAAQKNWPIHVFAMAILAHSLTKTAVSVWAGRLADLIGPQRLFAWTLLPLCGSCWALVGMDSILGVWVYMALAGVSTGCLGPIHGAMWPQRYGIRHIGAINGLTRMIGIATTALSPFLFGQLLDRGVTFDVILLSSLALMLLLTGITFGAFRATRAGLTSFHRHE